MKILLSAFACDPFFGSDEEVGWRWALELSSKGHEVWVITRRSHQSEIESFLAKSPIDNLKFVYVDNNKLHKFLKKFNQRNHIYYYHWQWSAYKIAYDLHIQHKFDLVHHVTWVSFRQPSFMGFLRIPFIFGPVAGGDEIPTGFTKGFSFKQKMVEVVRYVANTLVRFDPLMNLTFRTATKLIFTSERHLLRVPSKYHEKSVIELAIGVDEIAEIQQLSAPAHLVHSPRLLFAGRCIGWKGMDLGLYIFSKVLKKLPDAKLTIVGDGVDKQRWMDKAHNFGISDSIEWLGWLPKEQVSEMYDKYDLLFYPSLRDSGGFVVLEALQCGLPVVCYKLGGPGVVIDATCGSAIDVSDNVEDTCNQFSSAVVNFFSQPSDRKSIYQACINRANQFTWEQLVNRVYS